jgi:hypothetical protein
LPGGRFRRRAFDDPADFDDAAVDLLSDILHAIDSEDHLKITLRAALDRFAQRQDHT